MVLLGILAAVFAGIFANVQMAIYKEVFSKAGVFYALTINNIFTGLVCLALFFIFKFYPVSDFAYFQIKPIHWNWLYLIPGVLAVFLLILGPFSIAQLGALKAYLVLISFGAFTGIIWDYFVDGVPLNSLKVLGILVTFLGLIILQFS